MLMWNMNGHQEILLTRETVEMDGQQLYVWKSQDGSVAIEPRQMIGDVPLWLLSFYLFGYQYALQSTLPYNTAREFKWAEWSHVGLDPNTGLLYHTARAELNSRAVTNDELCDMQEWATRSMEAERLRKAEEALMAELHAEREKEREHRRQQQEIERRRKEAEERKRAAEDRIKKAADERARQAEEQRVRELEYQDAEWQAFLRGLAAEMAEHKEKVKEAKVSSWDERVAAKEHEAAERKELKRKRTELEEQRNAER
eukprot:6086464-Prymnesium_polylepis.1